VSVAQRAVTLAVAFVAVVALIVFVVVHILLAEPPTVSFTADHVAGS
jgi:thiosulfate reductase cytochrome b subunit